MIITPAFADQVVRSFVNLAHQGLVQPLPVDEEKQLEHVLQRVAWAFIRWHDETQPPSEKRAASPRAAMLAEYMRALHEPESAYIRAIVHSGRDHLWFAIKDLEMNLR